MAAGVTQVQQFTVTIPAGTTQAAPLSTRTALPDGFDVEWIELRWPPGPRGQVGIFIASSGQQVIPFRIGSAPIWLIEDGQLVRYDVDTGIDSGDWSVVGYNTGNYPHTIFVRYGITLLPLASNPAPPLLLPSGSLLGSAAGS